MPRTFSEYRGARAWVQERELFMSTAFCSRRYIYICYLYMFERVGWNRRFRLGGKQKRPLRGAVWCASASRHFSTHRSTPVRTGNCISSRQDVVSFPGHTSKGEGVEIRRTTVSIMKCAVGRAFRDGEGALSFTTFYKPPNSVPPKPPMISAPSGDRHQVAFSRAYEPVAL